MLSLGFKEFNLLVINAYPTPIQSVNFNNLLDCVMAMPDYNDILHVSTKISINYNK